jgi:hypothetical protein
MKDHMFNIGDTFKSTNKEEFFIFNINKSVNDLNPFQDMFSAFSFNTKEGYLFLDSRILKYSKIILIEKFYDNLIY